MALPGFFELSVSANRTKNNLGIPIIQILRSWSCESTYDYAMYRDFTKIAEMHNRDESNKIMRYRSATCFISNEVDSDFRRNVADLDISLFLLFTINNRFENNIISLEEITEKYSLNRNNYRNQINKLIGLEFSCYYPHEKAFFFNRNVFDFISSTKGFISYKFSDEYSEIFLKSGKKIYIPKSTFTAERFTRNAFFAMSHLFFYLDNRIQETIKTGAKKRISVTYGMYDYLRFCGINIETNRLDQLLMIITDVFMAFLYYDQPNYISSIIINDCIIFGKESFTSCSDMALSSFMESNRTKNHLLASSVKIIFDFRSQF